MPLAHQKESGYMYNQAGVDALDAVRAVVASFGAPIAFRKLYGLLNAMEMHVEETPYSVEALQHLGRALEATARLLDPRKSGWRCSGQRTKSVDGFARGRAG